MSTLASILNQKSYGFFIPGVDKDKIPCMIRVSGEWTNKKIAERETRVMRRKLKDELVQL